MSLLFTVGDQTIGVSASALVLSMNIQGWFPLGLTSLISLQSRGLCCWQSWHPLACSHPTYPGQALPLSSQGCLLSVSLCVSPFFHKDPQLLDLRATLIQDNLILITSAKIILPNKSTL